MEYLSKRYHLNHICISSYNSRTNGMVERSHFDVRQSLFKVVDCDQKWWSLGVYSVFWAERVTPCKRMGCSPYFAITGAHPILPFDIAEATYLQPPPTSIMSTTDLISHRAIALQKCSTDARKVYWAPHSCLVQLWRCLYTRRTWQYSPPSPYCRIPSTPLFRP
jgi:hypothetical protein